MTRALLVATLGIGLGSAAWADEKAPAAKPAADKAPAAKPADKAPAAKPADKAPPAGAAPAGPPAPAPEFTDATKYFLGKWKCDGKMPAGPWGPEAKETTNLNFKMDLGGFYMAIDGDMKSDSKPPMKMMFRGWSGWDGGAKKIMRTDLDSMGGWVMFSSSGWEGDKIVFTGEGMMMGQKMKMRHTMTKKSDTEMTSAFESAGPDGKWAPMGDDTCKKAGKK